MWWREFPRRRRRLGALGRLAVALAAASLTAGCFEPLYGNHLSAGSGSVYVKLNAVDIPPIDAPKGTPAARIAVGVRNALLFDLNGGAGATAPTHRLEVTVRTTQSTIVVNPTNGLPDAQVASVIANYQLVEIATGQTVVNDRTYADVDYDAPGPQQFFAVQRARRDAEDRAMRVVAETIRNRLASYFVAGT